MCPWRTGEGMNTISGSGNWELTYRREGSGVTLLRCRTCDSAAALPETVEDLPVTALGERALSPEASEIPGETIRITCGPDGGVPWDNRRLRELALPAGLNRVGNYALYNCRSLERLRLWDRETFWGNGVLTNCPIHWVELTQTAGDQGTIAYFAVELNREVEIGVLRQGETALRLVFPSYREVYEENSPAHHFDYTIEGAGYPYHHCFRNRKLDVIEYDRLWGRTKNLEPDTALRLAFLRLRYPEGLTDWAEAAYLTFLRSHSGDAVRGLIVSGDVSGLAFLLDRVRLESHALSGALALARDRGCTGAVALLLEHGRAGRTAADRFAL